MSSSFESSRCRANKTSWDINYILKHRDEILYDVYVEESIVSENHLFFRKLPVEALKIFEVPIRKIVSSYLKFTFIY